jgi:fibronectin-binding autotransporter adhesin
MIARVDFLATVSLFPSLFRRDAPRKQNSMVKHSIRSVCRSWGLFLLAANATGWSCSVLAASDSWKADVAGSWNDSAKWTAGNIPGSTTLLNNTDVATFGITLTGDRTVTMDSNRNIGTLTFSHTSDKRYTLSNGSLKLSSGGLIQSISASGARTDTISSPIEIQGEGGTATFTAGGGTATSLLSLGALTGISSGANTTTLTLNGANTGANAITGIIGDGANGGKLAIVKDGEGTWRLSGSNTYSGGLTLIAGTLIVGNNALGTGVLTINGGILDVTGVRTTANNNSQNWNGDFTFAGASTLHLGTGAVTLGANLGVTVVASMLTVGGVIDDGASTCSLTKDGAGNLVLSGANTYGGGTIVNAGTLGINNASALGTGVLTINGGGIGILSGAAIVNTNNNAQLWQGDFTFDSSYNLDLGTGPVMLGGNRTISAPYTYSTLTVAGVIDDGINSYSLTKTDVGRLSLAGANTYNGGTILSAGTLNINNAQALGTGALTINGGTIDNSTTGTIVNVNNNVQYWNEDFAFWGTKSLNLGTGGVTLGKSLSASCKYNTLTVSGVINDGGHGYSLTKSDIGTLALAGANTYSGGTILNTGTLNINNAQALGTGVLTINGGTIDNSTSGSISNVNNNAQNWDGNFVFHGTKSMDLGTGAVTLGGNRTVSCKYNTLAVGGVIDDGGFKYSLTKDGANTLVLAGANTYHGATTISNGTLEAAHAQALQYSTVNYMSTGGTLTFGNGSVAYTLGGLTGDKNLALANKGKSAITLTVGNNAYDTTYSGSLSGTGGCLVKIGSGMLTLFGVNTYTGGTSNLVGVLSIATSSALGLESNPLTIGGGATLKATDSFNTSRSTILGGAGDGEGGTFDVAAGKTLDYTASSVISGTGSLIKTGAGILSLGGVDTYTGGTYMKAGTLISTSGQAPGPQPPAGSNLYAHHIYDGATLQIAVGSWSTERQIELVGGAAKIDIINGFTQQRNGLIYGAGKLELVGTGTMIVTGTNTYTGGTVIEQGVFQANNSTGSATGSGAVTVKNNGTLSGLPTAQGASAGITGCVSGLVDIQETGKLLTRSGGTLTLGGLTLSAGAISTFQLGAPTATPLVAITGTDSFAIPGVSIIEIVNAGTLGAGTYRLFDYSGNALSSISNLTLASSGSGAFKFTLVNNTSATSIDLLVAPANNQWIRPGASNQNWSASGNWSSNDVPDSVGEAANFGYNAGHPELFSSAETATLDVSKTVGSVNFNNTNTAFTIDASPGQTLTLDQPSGHAVIQVFGAPNTTNHVISAPVIIADPVTVAIASVTRGLDIRGAISGSGMSLTKTDVGPLTLSGGTANTYTGVTEVEGGTLNLNKTPGIDAIGAGGLQIDFGATVTLSASNQIADSATVTVNGTFALGAYSEMVAALIGSGWVTTDHGCVLSLGSVADSLFLGIISGTGGIAKTGTGALTLSGINTYSGGTTINEGVLEVGADNNLGDSAGEVAFNGGTLFFTGSFTSSRNMLLNSGGGTFDTDGCGVILTGQLRGAGILTKAGTGTVKLSNANTYTGATIVNNGILRMSDTLSLGTADGGTTVHAGGEIELEGSNLTVNEPLTLHGGEVCNLANTNTYGGPITLTADSAADADNGTLIITSVIGGDYGLRKVGGGTVEFSNANSYRGTTIIDAGTLMLSSSGSLDAESGVSIAAGATFDVSAKGSSYNWGESATLSASGSGVGETAAIIKAAPGGTVNLGTRPIVLTYDGLHPALYIAQGTLSLSGNMFTVNGPPLPVGTYTIAQQASGTIATAGTHTVAGTALGDFTGTLSINAGFILLTVTDGPVKVKSGTLFSFE